MTTINLSNEQLTQVVAASILQALTPETREELITKAVADHLQGKESYNSPTRLQAIFNRAVSDVAGQLLKEHLATSEEWTEKVRKLLADAAAKVFDDEGSRAQTVQSVADAIRKGMTGDRY